MRAPVLIALATACAAAAGGAAAAPARPVTAAAASSPATCAGADQAPTPATIARARAAIACLVDAARAERGLAPLRRDGRLRTAAQRFAGALDPRRPLTHTGAGGSTPLDRIAATGYGRGTGFSAGEALGRGEGSYATPAVRVSTWLDDADTRRTLLAARFRDVGVGVVVRGATTTYVVELGARTPVSSPGRR